jgi:hypothetical protein
LFTNKIEPRKHIHRYLDFSFESLTTTNHQRFSQEAIAIQQLEDNGSNKIRRADSLNVVRVTSSRLKDIKRMLMTV